MVSYSLKKNVGFLFLGTGSVLNANGDVEMDAVIMDGKTLKSGAVACVHNIQNPIILAREVMEKVIVKPEIFCVLIKPSICIQYIFKICTIFRNSLDPPPPNTHTFICTDDIL